MIAVQHLVLSALFLFGSVGLASPACSAFGFGLYGDVLGNQNTFFCDVIGSTVPSPDPYTISAICSILIANCAPESITTSIVWIDTAFAMPGFCVALDVSACTSQVLPCFLVRPGVCQQSPTLAQDPYTVTVTTTLPTTISITFTEPALAESTTFVSAPTLTTAVTQETLTGFITTSTTIFVSTTITATVSTSTSVTSTTTTTISVTSPLISTVTESLVTQTTSTFATIISLTSSVSTVRSTTTSFSFSCPFVTTTSTSTRTKTIVSNSTTETSTATNISVVTVTSTTGPCTTQTNYSMLTLTVSTGTTTTNTVTTISSCTTCTGTVLPDCPGPLVQCPHRHDGFVLIANSVPRAQADCMCRRIRKRLANIVDGGKLLVAGVMAEQCLGLEKMAWIGEYEGIRDECLVVKSDGSTGIVGRAEPCIGVSLPVLCS